MAATAATLSIEGESVLAVMQLMPQIGLVLWILCEVTRPVPFSCWPGRDLHSIPSMAIGADVNLALLVAPSLVSSFDSDFNSVGLERHMASRPVVMFFS